MTTSTTQSEDALAVTATFLRRDRRGVFVEAVNHGPWETVVTGTMKTGAVIGNHYHKHTRMFFFVLSGGAIVTLVNVETGKQRSCKIEELHGLSLNPGEAHAIRFLKDSTFLLLKSLPYDDSDPDTFAYQVEPEKTT